MPWIIKIALFLFVIVILVGSYVSWRLVDALRQITSWNHLYIKWMVYAVFIYLFIYPFLGFVGYLFGVQKIISALREGNKVIDYFFMYPFWFGLVFILQLGILFFYLEIVRFLFSLLFRSDIAQLRTVHAWLVLIITVLTASYVTVRIYLDTKRVKTEVVKVQIPKLPGELQGFKIVHISDIQADSRTTESRVERYISVVNELNPDIVVFTGDLITHGTDYIERAAEIMGGLKAKYGVYGCLGDHDYWSNPRLIVQSLGKHGVKILENENLTINVGSEGYGDAIQRDFIASARSNGDSKDSTKIFMTAVTNIYSKRPNREILKSLTNQSNGSSLRVFITHQPSKELVEFAARSNYDIFLAGHTHGGQVVFSIFGIKVAGATLETNYLSGQHRFDSMFINMNNGLGLTLAPIRYNAPANITLLKLEKEN
jgi:hypothetical protein